MYKVNTRERQFIYPTLTSARKFANSRFNESSLRRGHSLSKFSVKKGNRTLHFIHILNSKGKVVSGCVIYKDQSGN